MAVSLLTASLFCRYDRQLGQMSSWQIVHVTAQFDGNTKRKVSYLLRIFEPVPLPRQFTFGPLNIFVRRAPPLVFAK